MRVKDKLFLYCLTFEDGDLYFGIALDPLFRRITHESLAFRYAGRINFTFSIISGPFSKKEANSAERAAIKEAKEKGFSLRNKTFVGKIKGRYHKRPENSKPVHNTIIGTDLHVKIFIMHWVLGWSQAELAREYGVNSASIWAHVHNKVSSLGMENRRRKRETIIVPRCVLSDNDCAAIRWLRSQGFYLKDIAFMFDCAQTTISKIVKNKRRTKPRLSKKELK